MGAGDGDGDGIMRVGDGGFGDATERRGVAVSYLNNALICVYMLRSDGDIDFFRMEKKGLFKKRYIEFKSKCKLSPEKLPLDIKNMLSLIEDKKTLEDDKKTLEDI